MICSIEHINTKDYYFDEKKAGKLARFFQKYMVHIRGEKAGQPFVLDDWQKFHSQNVFGWFDKKTHNRKHRFFYLEVPKGNGKSAWLSGITIFMAISGVMRGENYCVAGDRFQARIVFDACAQMINDNPKIRDKFEVYKHSIIHKRTKSVIYVISAETAGKHGFRPYSIAFDEVHVQKNRDLYDTLVKGLIKTPNSLCTMITTAGIKNTFAEEIHLTASQIARGLTVNDSWYAAIYSADEDDDPFAEETIRKANPGYGSIFKAEDFKIVIDDTQAQTTGLNSYKRLHLNIWTGSTKAWIPVHVFDKCDLGPVDLQKHEDEQTVCYGGLDLASTRDLSSFAIVFDNGEDKPLDLVLWFWCPEDTVRDRTKNENVNYEHWVETGAVFATPGNVQDFDAIEQFISEQWERFNMQAIAYDRALAYKIAPSLQEKYGCKMEPFAQTLMQFSPPTKEAEKLIYGQKINHGGNPVLRWQIDNVEIYEDTNENRRPHKGKSRGKIDGVIAWLQALGEWMDVNENKNKKGEVQIYSV